MQTGCPGRAGSAPELARQWAPSLGTLAPFAGGSVLFGGVRASYQLSKVLCRLDREGLDCIVVKTHLGRADQTQVPCR